MAETRRTRRSLPRDVVSMGGTQAILLVLQLAGTILIARALGPTGRGELAVAMGIQLVLQQVGTFGLVSANPYFVARDETLTARVATNSLWFALALAGPLVLAGVALKLLVPSAVQGVGWTELLVVLAAIPGALAASFLQSILLGEGRIRAYNGIEMGHGIVVLIGLLLVLVLGGDVLAVLLLYTVLYYVTTGVTIVLLLRHGRVLTRPDITLARRMIGYAFRLYVATLLAFLVIRVDILMVNGYLGSEEAGYYSLVAGIAASLQMIPLTIGLNLFPRVAEGSGDELTAQVFRLTSLAFGAVCLLSAATASILIPAFFGREFEDSIALYYWLAPGIFFVGMLTVLSHHFAGRGFPREAMLVWFIGLALNVVMNVVLLPTIGTVGASISSSAAYGLLLVLHMRMLARDTGYRALVPRLGELVRTAQALIPRRA